MIIGNITRTMLHNYFKKKKNWYGKGNIKSGNTKGKLWGKKYKMS